MLPMGPLRRSKRRLSAVGEDIETKSESKKKKPLKARNALGDVSNRKREEDRLRNTKRCRRNSNDPPREASTTTATDIHDSGDIVTFPVLERKRSLRLNSLKRRNENVMKVSDQSSGDVDTVPVVTGKHILRRKRLVARQGNITKASMTCANHLVLARAKARRQSRTIAGGCLFEPAPKGNRSRTSSHVISEKPAYSSSSQSAKPKSEWREYGLGGSSSEAFDSTNYTKRCSSFDKQNRTNELFVVDYVADIFQRLYNSEGAGQPAPYWKGRTQEIHVQMRSSVVEWLIGVHHKLRMVPATLHLCINILDRFLQQSPQRNCPFQLTGITALFIASKYEEVYPPKLEYLLRKASNCTYIDEDILAMEDRVVKALGYRFSVPTSYPFLRRFVQLVCNGRDRKVENRAMFCIERMLTEYDMLKYRGSLVAAAAATLAVGSHQSVPKVLVEYTGFREKDVQHVAKTMSGLLLRQAPGCSYASYNKKRMY